MLRAHCPKNLLLLCLVATVLLAVAAAAQAPPEGAAHSWTYSGDHGPDDWGKLSPEFATCSIGHHQSPINIVNPKKAKLPTIDFAYHTSPLKVINNGHTVQVNYEVGSSITRDGKTYDLEQFHFHHMSENAIKAKHTPMELHLVHKAQDGSLVVVAVMLKEGKANHVVSTVWSNISTEEGKENAPAVLVDAAGLLPRNHSYYTFEGSLTTPPCTENVTWFVLAKPITISKEQIAKFAALYPSNNRPVQPLNGRIVLESK